MLYFQCSTYFFKLWRWSWHQNVSCAISQTDEDLHRLGWFIIFLYSTYNLRTDASIFCIESCLWNDAEFSKFKFFVPSPLCPPSFTCLKPLSSPWVFQSNWCATFSINYFDTICHLHILLRNWTQNSCWYTFSFISSQMCSISAVTAIYVIRFLMVWWFWHAYK